MSTISPGRAPYTSGRPVQFSMIQNLPTNSRN